MPLLGSYGGSSEYAYRGTLDDFPNDFSFTNLTNLNPGGVYVSDPVTITGINNKSIVNISPGSTISINNGPFIFTSDTSTTFVTNNDTIRLRIPTSSGNLTDFSKTYSSTVKVGRKSATWTISTRAVDETPNSFVFTNLTNQEIGIALTSNQVVLSGLDFGFSFPASITSGNGQISINGGPLVSSGSVTNGDRIYLRLNSPFEFSNNPTGSGVKTNQTSVRVGTFTTTWSISARDVDVFIDPFDFNDLNNVQPSSIFTAQSVNSLGVVTSISGADPGIPLVTAVSGCELRVEQPAPGGGWFIRSDYSPANTIVFNGDRLTARISSASTFSQTRVGVVTVSSQTGRFIVTTRPRPIDTVPDPFTFTDLTGQVRNVLVQSNEVTLAGMSTFGDQGVASIVTGTTGGNAQYQITRGTSIVKPFGIGTAFVQNGDRIRLRITSSNESNGSVNATFRVDGVDTSFILSGQTLFRDDIWTVNSVARVCDVTPFTITTLNNAERNTRVSTTFTLNGFENDCNMRVSVSGDSTATLSVPGQTGTNNLPVSPGAVVTLSLTSGNFSQTKTVTITVSNAGSGVDPSRTYTTTWTVNTRADNTPASVTLTASNTLVQLGSPLTLTWSSVNAERVTSTAGFTTTALSGSFTLNPTTAQTYSISVEPKPAASNFPVIQTSSVFVSVQDTVINPFTIAPRTDVNPDTIISATFVVSGFQSNSQVRVSTSNPNSTLSVPGQTGTNNLLVNPGTTVTVFLRSGAFSETRTTTIRATNSGSGVTPLLDYSTSWSVTTRVDNSPASVTLNASRTTVEPGGSVTLTWSSVNAERVTSTIGFTDSRLSGSTVVNPTNSGTYSISVEPKPAASNFPVIQNSSVTITVSDITPDPFSLSPSSYSNQNQNSQVAFTVQSNVNSSVSVTGLSQGITVPVSVTSTNSSAFIEVNGTNRGTSFNVQNNDRIVIRLTNASTQGTTVSGSITIGSASNSFNSTTTSCTVTTGSLTIASGVTVDGKDANVTYQNGSTGTLRLYTGKSGFNLFSPCGPGSTTTSTQDVTINGSMTQSSCSLNVSGNGTIQAVNCGASDSGSCGTTTSVKHYLIKFTKDNVPLTLGGASFGVTSFVSKTAGGNSANIFIKDDQREGVFTATTGFRVWFCRNDTNNQGNTHVSAFSWTATGKTQVSTNVPADSYNTVIDTIVSVFNGNASRPPSLSEVQTFVNFYAAGNRSLAQLQTQIINSLNTGNKAISFTNNCGGPF